MNGSKPESPTNILALVALAALLIFAAAVIGSTETTAPSWISPEAADEVSSARVSASSQVAAGATPTGTAPATVIPAAGAAQPKCGPGVKGGCEEATVTDTPQPGTAQCPRETRQRVVNYACYQEGKIADIKTLKQTCSPGFIYTITVSKDINKKDIIKVTPTSLQEPPPGCSLTNRQPCRTGGQLAMASLSTADCQVAWDDAIVNFVASANMDPEEGTGTLSGLLGSLSEPYQAAFNEALGELKDEGQNEKLKIETKIADFRRIINNPQEYGANIPEVNAVKADLAALLKQNEELDKRIKGLDAAKVVLSGTRCGSEICASGEILGPDGKPLDERYRPAPVKDNNRDNNTFPPPETPPGGGEGGGGDAGIGGLLSSLMKMLQGGGGAPPAGNQTPKAPGTCSPQTMCSNGTLFSRSNQCVDTPIQQCPNGCAGNTCAQASRQPVAQLSCQPQIADVGMSIAITYACSAGMSVGSGFDTGGASSGATTATLTTPPIGTNTASYGLTCTNQGLSANASCSVQIGKPSIVLVTNPKTVPMNTAAAIGWVTAGMQSCVIGSPDLPDFTSANAGNTNVNGAVTTPALTGPARFILHCVTLGGGTRDASSTIEVAGVAGAVSLAISKPTAGQNVALGGTVQIAWNSEGAPSGAKMRLEVYPAGSAVVQGNNDKGIVSALPASGTFTWSLPAAGAACLADSGIISCLTPGQYKIVAKLYTGSECWGFCTAAASERTIRVVAESSIFTIAP